MVRSTQPCIPLGSLNRVPASAEVKEGGSLNTVWCYRACEFPQQCCRLDCELLYPYTILYFIRLSEAIQTARYLFKAALHSFVDEQCYRPHEVADKNKVAFRLDVESDDIVSVVTLNAQLFLSSPLKQTDLHTASQRFSTAAQTLPAASVNNVTPCPTS